MVKGKMSIFDGLFGFNPGQSSYRRKLEIYQKKHPNAKAKGATECQRSGCCCWQRPGRLTQLDLRRLAAVFLISQEEFFKQYCVVDNPTGGNPVVVLRRGHQTEWVGHYLSSKETYSIESPCVFFEEAGFRKENSCKVHWNKPAECADYKCWEEGKPPKVEWSEAELMALGWDGDMDFDSNYDPDPYESEDDWDDDEEL